MEELNNFYDEEREEEEKTRPQTVLPCLLAEAVELEGLEHSQETKTDARQLNKAEGDSSFQRNLNVKTDSSFIDVIISFWWPQIFNKVFVAGKVFASIFSVAKNII